MKWSTIRTPEVRMIFPDTVSAVAQRTLFCIRAVHPYIGYGFRHGPMRIPFVLHPENFRSNGLVMYLPKRVEFLTSPAIEGYSMPWYKQLVAHEYRHAVQYNNLDRGLVRILSYILGQQGSTIALLFMPIWAMEGDAVMSETEMSSFGRGLQPSFTLGYRAMRNIGHERRNVDRWFCGSYVDYIPDHYQLGYQICSYAYERYGENVWNKVARYSVRNPYMIVPSSIAFRKYYNTGEGRLFQDTFDELEQYWASLPLEEDTATPLTTLPIGNYTTYQWPLQESDTTVLVLKSDYNRTTRFVRIDTRTGQERLVGQTGALSTRPVLGNGRVWWTEYRRSKFFEQRVNSQLCYMNLVNGEPRQVVGCRRALFPTSAGDDLAWVDYNPNGRYTIVVKRGTGDEERFATPADVEIHGLAWDNHTAAYYVIVTDDSGMWLGRIDREGLHPLMPGAYITLSNLRAANGWLYFGSIASGKDEAHAYCLTTRRQYRLTTSAYGTFDPSPADSGVLVTTYDHLGYRVAHQAMADSLMTLVEPSRLPVNLVNPQRTRWNVINLDTVRFSAVDSMQQDQKFRTKRYRKVPNMVNIHSWMPLGFDPFAAVEEQVFDVNIGVTLLSQNLLSNTEAFTSYGWNQTEGSLFRLGIRYFGLGVHFDINAAYGGNQVFYSLGQYNNKTGVYDYQRRPLADKYYSVGMSATLPFYFPRGYHTRQFSFSVGWNYSNGMVANMGKIEWKGQSITNLEHIGFREGVHKLSFGAGYSDQVRLAHRDFAPRWGYVLNVNYTLNPLDHNFSDLFSAYGQVYLPGVAPHHSLTVATAFQTSLGGYKLPSGYAPLSYRSARLIPRGFTSTDIYSNSYTACAVNYQMPVWYPEGGIGSLLYFKRIRFNVGADYAQFRGMASGGMDWRRIWAIGGDVILDFNIFRQPASATTAIKLSLYRPSSGGVWFGVSMGLPF